MSKFDSRLRAALVAFLVAALPAAGAQERGVTDTSIKIGALGPFTGKAALFNPLNYGSIAYMRYVNDMGGVWGRKFDIVLGDSACAEAKGIAAAKKLIFDDQAFMILGNPCSGVAMAIKPTLIQENVVWSGVSANPRIDGSVGSGGDGPPPKYMFHTTPNGYFSGLTMGKFMMTKPGAKRIAFVAHTNDWARGYCDPAKEYIEANGGEVVLDTAMERGSTDATAQVLQIKAQNVDGILGCLYQPELVVLLKDAHKYQLGVPVIGALGADFGQTVQQVGNPDAVNGVFFQGHLYKDKIGAPSLEWARQILVKYLTKDELPSDGEPTHFYYFGMFNGIGVVEGFRRAGRELTRDTYIKAVETLNDFDTNLGAGRVTITADQHIGVSNMFFNGLDEKGNEVIFTAYGKPLH
ncbi:MAG: ABC transporter substrate-binding protein [Ectothiorhodospiraceae bacterium]|nr:ABC transporter substrate-binding protein [Chromatiales bacterium]MCP5155696.1 ABC transporter substrate-binding protein [Ectothiorhodospiraceae bacterium]